MNEECFVCGEPAGYLVPGDTHRLCGQICLDSLIFEIMLVTNDMV